MITLWTVCHIMQLLLSYAATITVWHIVFITSTRYPLEKGRFVAAVLLAMSAGLGMYVMLDYIMWVVR